MNVKSFIYIALAIAGMGLLNACQNEEIPAAETNEKELSFYPTVRSMEQQVLTRAATNTFFKTGDEVTVSVTTDRASNNSSSHIYTYDATGTFTGGSNPFLFKLDDTYIVQLKASWPTQEVRDEGIITDQRDFEEYRKADWLSAEAEAKNILPTDEPVPLHFEHEQSRLTFRIAGQNAYGIYIKDLIVGLDADLGNGSPEEAAFRAHCLDDGTAELILPAGTKIAPGGEAGSRALIGLVTLDSRDEEIKDYRGSIYIPGNTDITLKPNHDYLVTLTPEGYDLYAHITVDGFPQSEGYVGIPIQMPKKIDGSDNQYSIDTPLQLVTLSLLLQGGYIKSEEAVAGQWSTYTYTLKEGLTMTENAKLYYKPIISSLKGVIFGEGVTSIKDSDGADFNLFAE